VPGVSFWSDIAFGKPRRSHERQERTRGTGGALA